MIASLSLYAGFDGGGTNTRVAISDSTGRVLGTGRAGSCNYRVVSLDVAAQNLGSALADALAQAYTHVAPGTPILATFMGGAGLSCAADAEPLLAILRGFPALAGAPVAVENDIQISHAGGLGKPEGIALIAGTGSNCYGRRLDGREWHAGGQEYLIDDRGSGYRTGLEGIIAAVRASDERGPATALTAPIFAALKITSVGQIVQRLHHSGPHGQPVSKTEVGALAPLVITAAEASDAVAMEILRREIDELALMIATVARKIELPSADVRWVVTGSFGNCAYVKPRLEAAVQDRLPGSQRIEQVLPPVLGAILRAAGLAGHAINDTFVHTLQTTCPLTLR